MVRKGLEQAKLRRGVEILSEEVEERYHLIVGDSAKMKQAVDFAERPPGAVQQFYFLVKAAPAKKYSPAPSTTGAKDGQTFHRD